MGIQFLNSGFFSTVLYIGIAILVLLLMVMIHELGHYIAGRILKFKINEFSIGFGKAIFSKKNKRGELISLRIFPLGGYCAFEGEGEDADSEKVEDYNPQAFNNQKPWKRLIVLFAGAFFNFLSAIIFAFILLVSYGYDIVEVANQPSMEYEYALFQENELEQGDVIYAVNGEKINFANDATLNQLIAKCPKDTTTPIVFTVERNGEMIDVVAKFTPKLNDNIVVYFDEIAGEYKGFDTSKVLTQEQISQVQEQITEVVIDGETYTLKTSDVISNSELLDITNQQIYKYNKTENDEYVPVYQLGVSLNNHPSTFGEALLGAVPLAGKMAWVVLKSLFQLITFQIPINQIGGPITTITTIASYTQASFANFFVLLPLISANLAMFNLIPFPALDGAQMVFTTVEWIRRKPNNKKIESYINVGGLIFLMAFVVIVDILHFIL